MARRDDTTQSFDPAASSEIKTSVEEVLSRIAKQRERRQSNKVLHAHPSPMFWLDRSPPMARIFAAREAADATYQRRINLYIATPYCLKTEPERCGFCLFPSEDFRGQAQLETYLRYLAKEADLLRPHYEGLEASTVYLGGGTANLYKPEAYSRLVGVARSLYRIGEGAEITLEGIPQLFTYEKLAAMKEAGVTRVSVGVQQLQDDMIRLSGRRQTAKQVFDTIGWCQSLGLDVSVDLIFGWPGHTQEGMLRDLRAIVDTGIRHITHYELNVAGRSDFARNHRATLPSIADNGRLFEASKQFLEGAGFRQATVYDWERPKDEVQGKYLYEENLRTMFFVDDAGRLGRNEMHGLGFAGVTVALDTPAAPGWSYVNATRVDDYFAALDRGVLPVDRAYHHDVVDLRLIQLFQSLQSMSVDRKLYRTVFGLDVADEFDPTWEALERVGWALRTPEHVRIVGEGVVFTPLIQALLASDRIEEIRAKSAAASATAASRLVQIRTPPRASASPPA